MHAYIHSHTDTGIYIIIHEQTYMSIVNMLIHTSKHTYAPDHNYD